MRFGAFDPIEPKPTPSEARAPQGFYAYIRGVRPTVTVSRFRFLVLMEVHGR